MTTQQEINERMLKALKTALVTITAQQFSSQSEGDGTQWGCCPECYKADWRGHDKDCQLAANIKELQQEIDFLEKAIKVE